MQATERMNQLFQSFDQMRVMIIGDVMVDAYLFGKVDRISPEAPVPVVSVQKRSNRPGGAANVALNIKAMGAEPVLCSVIGDDQKGREFLEILDRNQIPSHGIIQSPDRITTTKFRVIGNNTQMLRVDEEVTHELNRREKTLMQQNLSRILEEERIDVLIFQDYNKGVIHAGLIKYVIDLARARKIPVVVDPKRKNFLNFKQVSLFKPNLKELFEGINKRFDSPALDEIKEAINELQQKIGAEMVLVTLSEQGVVISSRNESPAQKYIHIPALKRNIADVSGAGDTVVSVAALCLANNMDAQTLATISNLAGGLVCEEVGVVPVNKNKLLEEVFKQVAES